MHMRWKDGSVVHVYVTAEECRQYEEKMLQALVTFQNRYSVATASVFHTLTRLW